MFFGAESSQAAPVVEAAAAAACAGGPSDFNGDGLFDQVIDDPQASVGGVTQAGLVRVVLGGGKGVVELSEATPGVTATPEQRDQFGFSHAVFDEDQDGCSDLVVGVPFEDVLVNGANKIDAGMVVVFHGAPSGFGTSAPVDNWTQPLLHQGTAAEAYDAFGYAVQAGTTASGAPWMAIGVPGESLNVDGASVTQAGQVEYVQGSTECGINQNSADVPGTAEPYDRYGMSLASTNRFLAVGTPGEAIGDAEFAGGVAVFSHTLENGCAKPLVGMDQAGSSDGLSGTAEAGDRLGAAISMTGFRPSDQTANTDALLAIGVPGEAVGDVAGAGMVSVVHVTPTGAISEVMAATASTADVEGDIAVGDYMGQRVTISNTNTSVVTTSDTVRLAVGIPGRDAGSVKDAGAVQIFRPLDAAPGTADKLLQRASSGTLLPGPATALDYTGISLQSGDTNLYVGVPYSKEPGTTKGVLYALPWSVVDAGSGSVKTYKPGADGVPDAGVSFGVVG